MLGGCADEAPTGPGSEAPSSAAVATSHQGARVAVEPEWVTLDGIGVTGRLAAAVMDAAGEALEAAAVMWESADDGIATVDSTGLVTSVAYGITEITATSGPLTGIVVVYVTMPLSDREILEILYRRTGGEEWTDATNWLSHEPLDEWFGVEADDSGSVARLSLAENNLVGSIPLELAGLADLLVLDVRKNALSGRVPSDLGALKQVRDLLLSDNALEGPLPGYVGYMAGLRYLDIGTNDLAGAVPGSFARLELDTLYTSGSGVCLPPSLEEWFSAIDRTDPPARCTAKLFVDVVDLPSPNLYAVGETATLSSTYVSVEGDTTLGAAASWTSGDASIVAVNASTGKVTAASAGESEVTATYDSLTASIGVNVILPENDREILGVLYDRARGYGWKDGTNWLTEETLSAWAGVETDDSGRVVSLALRDNNLRGPLHSSIGRLDRLTTLDLSRNWITGPIPAELGQLTLLRKLILSANALVGELSPELGDLVGLRHFRAAATSLSGKVPAAFQNLDLESFHAGATALCVPPSLAAWLDSIASTDNPPECTNRVSVGPASLSFRRAGDTTRLSAMVIGPEGNVVESPTVTWASADSAVATVDSAGLVTAVATGATTVTATYDSASTGAADVAVAGSDRAVLGILFRATGGEEWTDTTNWMSNKPLDEWYGVQARDGRVTLLTLGNNNLAGPIPAALGLLEDLLLLDLHGNALTGPVPPAVARLRKLRGLFLDDNPGLAGSLPPWMSRMSGLKNLFLGNTGLMGPVPASLADLKLDRFFVQGTGLCLPRSLAAWFGMIQWTSEALPCIPDTPDREVLVTLYNRTGGGHWNRERNWLAGSVNAWEGVTTDEDGFVTGIDLVNNNMAGAIPPELGGIRTLRILSLDNNNLTGAIPAALARADSLESLDLEGNSLTGPIPPELGSLPRLTLLNLAHNSLTGPIPPELGDLPDLTLLNLAHNSLTGPVPAELGNLANLVVLYLHNNVLTDPLPPELGNLASLTHLFLDNNDLEGPVPSGWGRMSRLKELGLMNNSRMNGALPHDLTVLGQLRTLVAGGTGLCAPSDADFQTWLEGVPKRRIRACAGDLPVTYLTQAVQSWEFPVPLVAGEGALLRVFPTARRANDVGIPATRVRFYLDGLEAHVEIVPGKSSPIPTEVTEGDLSTSVNLEIDGSLVQPGLEVVIEVDPDGTLAPELGVQTRIPAAGRLGVEVQDVPVFDLTLIPFLWNEHPDSAIVALIGGMAEDPANHEMFWGTHTLLPVGGLEVNAHEPVLTSTNNGYELLFETRAIRAIEGGTGHYRGMMTGTVTGTNGVAFRPGRSSFGHPDLSTMETGFGFNLSLQSAPCGDPERPDPTFPYRDGSIGAWGYDTRDGGGLVSPSTPDLMSPCEPRWISDYHFTNALRYRLRDGGSAGGSRAASPTRALLLWGGVDSEGVPFLEPVVVVDAPPTLPAPTGDHEITGRAANGRELFSLRFSMPEVAHGDGGSSFAFVLPVGPGWDKDLSRITLSGPGGSVELDGESDRSVAILRDLRTGQVRGVLRDLPEEVLTRDDATAAVSAGRGLELQFSRGLPGPKAWRR